MNGETREPIARPAQALPAPRQRALHHRRISRVQRGVTQIRWATGLFSLAALVVLAPFWTPLVLSAWLAIVTTPLCQGIARRFRFRTRSAAPVVMTVVLVLAVLLPLSALALSVTSTAVESFQKLQHSQSAGDVLRTFSSGRVGLPLEVPNLSKVFELARSHASGALNALRVVSGALTHAVIGLVVFVAAYYVFLHKGAYLYAWLIERSPLAPQHSRRLGEAFAETGRGLLIGIGLTALFQGALAGVGYMITAVPQAFVLAILTALAALIPSVGSALVWVPVTIGLFVAGRTTAGVVMLAIGCCVSTADNLLRPFLSRFGKLDLNAFLLFLAMLGGIAVFGTSGLILGPLCVRLAIESLEIVRETQGN